ncbi:MAG: hypothetical protein WAU59_16025, partial [Rhodoplanes sp.]
PSDGAARVRGVVIYLKTAKGLAFDVPLVLLVRADRGGRAKMPFAAARKSGSGTNPPCQLPPGFVRKLGSSCR